jgi:hypothetical protein
MQALYEGFGLNPVTFEYKKGGVIKAQSGLGQKSWDELKKWRQKGLAFNNDYDYTYQRTTSDPKTGEWDLMYNIDPSQLTIDIEALNNVLNASKGDAKYNDPNWLDWNNAFNSTGLNKYFGWNENVAKYFGPTTYKRVAFLNDLQSKASGQNGYPIENGILRYDPQTKLFSLDKNEPTIKSFEQTAPVT